MLTSTTIVQCPKCFAGNLAASTSCHNCGGRLKVPKKGTVLGGEVTIADEHVHEAYIVDAAMATQRSREAKVARRLLAVAAILYLLRVALVPFLLIFVNADKFAPFCGPHVTPVHFVCLVVFGVCAFWARRQPLNATLTAVVLFLLAAVPGFVENPTITGGALVGKLLMLLLIGRALSAAIMYRVNCSRPELPEPPKKTKTPTPPSSDRIAA